MEGKKLSILLVTDHQDELQAICNLIKRHFPHFYISRTEEDAIKKITEHDVQVLMISLSSLQACEVFYLHLISAKRGIEQGIRRKIVFCSRDEIRDSFTICNKGIFDDYFVAKPMYDPYNILIRLRAIKQGMVKAPVAVNSNLSIHDLCNYFDRIINCQDELNDLNRDSYNNLASTITFSMQQLQEKLLQFGELGDSSRAQLSEFIAQHTESSLMQSVKEEQQRTQEAMQEGVGELAAIAKLKKQAVEQPPAAVAAVQACNMLIVEDEIDIRDTIRTYLDQAGFSAQVCGSARDALTMMDQWHPDIIMLDLSLPDLSPLFVIDKIKNHPKLTHTRIVVMAKPGDKGNADESLKMGVHELIRKPIDKDMLMYKVRYNLEQVAATRS